MASKGAGNHYVTLGSDQLRDVARASEVGLNLGWADCWVHLMCVVGLVVVCLWAQKRMAELTDDDLNTFEEAVDVMSANHRYSTVNRLFGVSPGSSTAEGDRHTTPQRQPPILVSPTAVAAIS